MKKNNLRSRIKDQGSKQAFTLMEILIIVSLVVILAIGLIVYLSPQRQINKSYDVKRKNDLSTLRKSMEDFYNDNGYYPKPSQVCYDSSGNNTVCHICGGRSGSPTLYPYMKELPCDPQTPKSHYTYEVDSASYPTLYQVFANLGIKDDPVIKEVGCYDGCGPTTNNITDCNYNYGIASSNTHLDVCNAATPTPVVVFGNNCSQYGTLYYIEQGICNVCNDYNNCKILSPRGPYYINQNDGNPPNCTKQCIPD